MEDVSRESNYNIVPRISIFYDMFISIWQRCPANQSIIFTN